MRRATNAYTLIELLIVIAILAVLSALLTPVFISVKSSAQKSVCFSHFKQTAQAAMIYSGDYDDYFMPISYMPGQRASSREDRTWVQLLLPYAPSFSIFLCPSDTSRKTNQDSMFDQDLVPGDLYSEYYRGSKHTNMGFNYMALSPVVKQDGKWNSVPIQFSSVWHPSSTLLFVDSVWSQAPNGQPVGGGNWLVEPPCRYTIENGAKKDLLAVGNHGEVYSNSRGWSLSSGEIYGGAWPWHSGHVNIARVDGSAYSYTTSQLTSGCNVQAHWAGDVTSTQNSMWFSSP